MCLFQNGIDVLTTNDHTIPGAIQCVGHLKEPSNTRMVSTDGQFFEEDWHDGILLEGFGSHEIQDRMVDFGIQSYWLSHHPFVVPEPFTPEPCETYSKEDLEYWAAVIEQACREARENPELIRTAPHNQAVGKIKDFSAADDPERWAITWRGWRKKKGAGGPHG